MIAATVLHAPVLAKLHEAAFAPEPGWSAKVFAFQLGLPGVFGFFGPESGLVLARHVADEAEIITIGVVAEARRGGHGSALLGGAMTEAARRGAVAMFLEVSTDNLAAREFYAANGFAKVGFRRNYYRDGEHAELLRAALSANRGTVT
jgi:ribosomal-protein-alanine N-acetyltransferase